jgi:hypothetical protein
MATFINARLDPDKPTEDPTFEGFMEIVHIHDRTRLLGDLWNRVATDPSLSGILIHMATGYQSQKNLDKTFLDQADAGAWPSWSVLFHIELEYQSGRDMTGGLELMFQCEPGRTPRYNGFRIHT